LSETLSAEMEFSKIDPCPANKMTPAYVLSNRRTCIHMYTFAEAWKTSKEINFVMLSAAEINYIFSVCI
jgi:hypothetical protein